MRTVKRLTTLWALPDLPHIATLTVWACPAVYLTSQAVLSATLRQRHHSVFSRSKHRRCVRFGLACTC